MKAPSPAAAAAAPGPARPRIARRAAPSAAAKAVTSSAAPTSPVCESRSEEHTSELQSQSTLVCRLLLEKKKSASSSITQTTSYNNARSMDAASELSNRHALPDASLLHWHIATVLRMRFTFKT